MRVQMHDYGDLPSPDWPCSHCRVPWTKRDKLSCIFREVDAAVTVRPNPSPVFGYPNIDLDRLRILRDGGEER